MPTMEVGHRIRIRVTVDGEEYGPLNSRTKATNKPIMPPIIAEKQIGCSRLIGILSIVTLKTMCISVRLPRIHRI